MGKTTHESIIELVAAIDTESKQRHIDDYRSSQAFDDDVVAYLRDRGGMSAEINHEDEFIVFVHTAATSGANSARLTALILDATSATDEYADNHLVALRIALERLGEIADGRIKAIDAEISERKAAEDQEVSP